MQEVGDLGKETTGNGKPGRIDRADHAVAVGPGIEAGAVQLSRHVRVPVEIIVVVREGDDRGALGIGRDLEVVAQVPVQGPGESP